MKNNRLLIWIILMVLILGIIKFFFLSPKPEGASSAQAAGGKGKTPPNPVSVFVVQATELNNLVYASGTVLANEEVVLMPELAGKVVALQIQEGRTVSKGDLLLKINDADFQAQQKKLQQQVQLSEEKVKRQKQLLAINGISQEEYDAGLSALYALQADLEMVKAQIAKTEIRAPFSGTIGLRYVSEGAYVNSSTRIATIVQLNPVKIDFSVPEQYASQLSAGNELSFRVPESNELFKAKIIAIEPKIDLATRTLQLRALADNSRQQLYPGGFAKIELPLRKITNALMIPTEAIIPVLKGKKVFVCKMDTARQVMVETGIRNDRQIQVTSGLQAGDSVITSGIMQLKDGSPVKVVKQNSSPKK